VFLKALESALFSKRRRAALLLVDVDKFWKIAAR